MRFFKFPIFLSLLLFFGFESIIAQPHGSFEMNEISENPVIKTPDNGGIKEVIAGKYEIKYQRWKQEFLSTDFGREQWEKFDNNKHFILTITISDEPNQGAGTGEYKWNEAGELVAATINLGSHLDKGFPGPVYFPVMNSLSLDNPLYSVSGSILAATKFAHEFGHVNLTARTKGDLFRLQNNLIPNYNKILLDNGYNTKDKRLIDLANQMGGTPVEVWENREYWGEANAMMFLRERLNKENFYCLVFQKIKNNVEVYAKNYEERFDQVESLKTNTCTK